MSLKEVASESREIIEPNQLGDVVLSRTVESDVSPPSLLDYEVRGYSNAFGGQNVSSIDFQLSTSNSESGGRYYLDIEFQVDSFSAPAGSDFVFEYEVKDDNVEETSSFFFQNGVSSARDLGDLTFRASAELERLSGIFDNEQKANDPTDYSDLTRRATSDFDFISTDSPFSKHDTEPVPYFSGSGKMTLPSQPFSDRNSTVALVLHWNQIPRKSFPVATFEQGDKTYLEVLNNQDEVEVQSDFSSTSLYRSSTYRDNILLVACEIGNGVVKGSVNREITRSAASLNVQPFDSGEAVVNVNPEGKPISPKLFDVIAYDESVSLDRLAKQLSYFYAIDMSSPEILNKGPGSPMIQSHLFYDEEVEEYDIFSASGDLIRRTSNGNEVWRFTGADVVSVAVDSRSQIGVGTFINNNVHKLSSSGDIIWTYDGHTDTVNAVELSRESREVFSASSDGTLKKLGPEGIPVWNFGEHTDEVNDVAVYKDEAAYTASSDETVRRVVNGSEVWKFEGHLDEVTAISVGRDGVIYSGAANGEIRVIDDDAKELYLVRPTKKKVTDISVSGDGYIYVSTGRKLLKLNASDGSTVWTYEDFELEVSSLAVSPDGPVYASAGLIHKIDEDGNVISSFGDSSSITPVADELAVQPGSESPHRIE